MSIQEGSLIRLPQPELEISALSSLKAIAGVALPAVVFNGKR